ncbi:MAG: transcription termination factor Rho [Actinomycetota bacterium]
MSDQLIVERSGLEKKDKGELQAIVSALGGKASARSKKAELIDQIIELSGATLPGDGGDEPAPTGDAAVEPDADAGADGTEDGSAGAEADSTDDTSDDSSDAAAEDGDEDKASEATADTRAADAAEAPGADAPAAERSGGRNRRGRRAGGDTDSHPVGPDGEPLADWEVEMMAESGGGQNSGRQKGKNKKGGGNDTDASSTTAANNNSGGRNGDNGDEVDPNNRRSRRRRGRGRDRDDVGNEPVSSEPVPVSGALDLRDEGYGFLRVDGFLPSKDDVYVSVKQVRQFGLRKGDHLTGLSRPASRNEKNPGFHQIDTVNGGLPASAKDRPRFDALTPLFPDEQLTLEMKEEPLNMTTRIIDLVSPIGKGQRGLIVSPPKAGKTSVMKDIARAVETNNPDAFLIVLLLDERPEEVTDMQRHLTNGEVAASTFDRPPEEHVAVAELTIERAKRMVESGADVIMIVDGITRLARAYNLTAPQSGRAMSGGLDAAALYPAKRFFGAARNLEEGGSLTILATALVETGSRMDEVIFEEFKGTGNMELRLDRRLAEKRIFPAIDVDGSSTRREELLYDRKELQLAWKLRRVLSAMGEEGTSAAGIEMLVERLATFKTNSDFLAEMAKQPS